MQIYVLKIFFFPIKLIIDPVTRYPPKDTEDTIMELIYTGALSIF